MTVALFTIVCICLFVGYATLFYLNSCCAEASFGMVFGARRQSSGDGDGDEWSTEDEDSGSDDDYSDDEGVGMDDMRHQMSLQHGNLYRQHKLPFMQQQRFMSLQSGGAVPGHTRSGYRNTPRMSMSSSSISSTNNQRPLINSNNDEDEDGTGLDADSKRKLKNSRKSERRRKTKEKQQREVQEKKEEEERMRLEQEVARAQLKLAEEEEKAKQEVLNRKRKEEQRCVVLTVLMCFVSFHCVIQLIFVINDCRAQQEAEERHREGLFTAVTSGEIEKVLEILDGRNTGAQITSGTPALLVTERRVVKKTQGAGLLHMCCSDLSHGTTISREVCGRKLHIAEYLLGKKNPSLDFRVLDEHGHNVLHYAAAMNDFDMVQLLLKEREGNSERRIQLDLNERCSTSGMAALHYSVNHGNLFMSKSLLEAGAHINVRTSGGNANSLMSMYAAAGMTPLELVQLKVQRHKDAQSQSSSKKNKGKTTDSKVALSATQLQNLNAVSEELTIAIKEVERLRHIKDQEKQQKDASLAAEKSKQAEKDLLEAQLLERKQNQLREKQKREKQKIVEEEELRKSVKLSVSKSLQSGTGADAKKSKKNKTKDVKSESPGTLPSNAGTSTTSHVSSHAGTHAITDAVPDEAELKALKEKQMKEEQRRINRAWNQKTEDEKRK